MLLQLLQCGSLPRVSLQALLHEVSQVDGGAIWEFVVKLPYSILRLLVAVRLERWSPVDELEGKDADSPYVH